MSPGDRFLRVRFHFKDEGALRNVPMEELDTACMGGLQRHNDGSFDLVAQARESVVVKAKRVRGVKVEVLADLAEEAKRLRRQIQRDNPFQGENWIPRGLGRKFREGDER